MLLFVATAKNWVVHQLDVHNAFPHGDLLKEFYMRPQPDFRPSTPSQVCRLCKSLYGLRQAPRCWFSKFTTTLCKYGFVQSYADYSLFTHISGDDFLCVLIYVDDLLITGHFTSCIAKFKRYLSSCFHMKDHGPLKHFLGIKVARNSTGIYLRKRKYILEIFSKVGR